MSLASLTTFVRRGALLISFMVIVLTNLYLYFANRRNPES